jgi:adenylosuccinate synthase
LRDCRTWQDLPANARAYVEYLERATGLTIKTISVGPERSAMILR